VRWQRSLGSPITVDPVVDESVVYAATDAGVLSALDRGNGRAHWRRSFPRVTGLACDGETLYVAADRLYALRANDGADRWAIDVGDHPTTPPSVHDGTVYVGSPEPRLYAFTGAGEQEWRTVPLLGTLTAPAVDESGVYVADGRGFYGLRRDTGQQRWQVTSSSQAAGAATVANDRVYVPFAGGSLYGVSKADGKDRFTVALEGTPQVSPAVDEEGVYLTDTAGNFHKLSPHDGTELWAADLENAAYSAPALAGEFVYVGDETRLYAFARDSGVEVWSWKAGGSVRTGAAVVDGTVYVAGSNWRLTALS
jgi:outer membrane protein assembly factor BamB